MWILFQVPCPTPDGQTAQDLYEKRVRGITPEMRASARVHGCRFHQAWYAADGSAFWAVAEWESAAGANAFFTEWAIDEEPGEIAVRLEGEVGLVTLDAILQEPDAMAPPAGYAAGDVWRRSSPS
jgi:hypothetical protein